jgi:hypothetical protein
MLWSADFAMQKSYVDEVGNEIWYNFDKKNFRVTFSLMMRNGDGRGTQKESK